MTFTEKWHNKAWTLSAGSQLWDVKLSGCLCEVLQTVSNITCDSWTVYPGFDDIKHKVTTETLQTDSHGWMCHSFINFNHPECCVCLIYCISGIIWCFVLHSLGVCNILSVNQRYIFMSSEVKLWIKHRNTNNMSLENPSKLFFYSIILNRCYTNKAICSIFIVLGEIMLYQVNS